MLNLKKVSLPQACLSSQGQSWQNGSFIYFAQNRHLNFNSTHCAQGPWRRQSSVRPKPGFGISNRNQDQVLVSVSGPELFLPKPKLSPILKIYQKIISVMT